MRIKEITEYSLEVKEAIDNLLGLLVGKDTSISEHQLREIIASNNSHLFFALGDKDAYIGMLTVGIYQSPTGKKAWIEDVVVDEAYRGKGVGKNLAAFAIQFAKQQHVDTLMLTSNPARVAANSLYKKMGFEQRETNVYRMIF